MLAVVTLSPGRLPTVPSDGFLRGSAGMALAAPLGMELVLQRYSWAFDAVAVLLGAYLAARTVNTIAAAAIAPKPALVQQAGATPQSAAQPQRVELDADKVAKLFDVPLPKPPAPGGEGVRQLSENQYVVARSEINNALTNLSDLATKARIVPSFKNGVANGFKLFSIVPDSLYAKIGVQNGDVIRRINGYEMNSPDKALEIYQKLRDANRIEIELERRGETLRKSYSIE